MTASVGSIRRLGGFGNESVNLVTITLDDSYATSGEPITANQCGLSAIHDLVPLNSTLGWQPAWDQAALKLFMFGGVSGSVLSITKTVAVASMTDNTDTTGYIDFATNALPSGAIPLMSQFACSVAFSGDTSAVWQLGIAGDLDRYSALTTNSCFTAITTSALVKNATAAQGTNAARTPRLTVTGGADFTTIKTAATAAGVATLFYALPAASLAATAETEVASTTDLSTVTVRALVFGPG